MAEQTTNPATGVEQAPSAEDRMLRFFQQREEQPQAQSEPEQAETQESQEAPQPVDQAQAGELTPEDIPDDDVPVQSAVESEFEIVHNGQQKRLSREETIRLAQQGFDYTVKTQEVAARQKAVEQAYQRAQEVMQLAPQVAQDLAAVKALESQLQNYQKVDWVQLATNDPLEYPKYRAQYDTLVNAYQQAQGQFRQKFEAVQVQQQQFRESLLQEQRTKLLERIPEWKDPAKFQAGAKDIREYLLSEGANAEAVDQLSDALAVSITRKAMLYDRLQKAKMEKVKMARTQPPVTRPGSAQAPEAAKAERVRDTEGRFKKSGDQRDAVQVLLNRWRS